MRFVTVKNRGNVSAMLNWTIAAECKKCAQGQFADSTFAKDLKRMQGSLKVGGVVLSADFDAARNQIAAFVSKGARTTYGELSGAEKGKAHIVMALLSQETAKAAFDGQFTALDKKNTMIYDGQLWDARVLVLKLISSAKLKLSVRAVDNSLFSHDFAIIFLANARRVPRLKPLVGTLPRSVRHPTENRPTSQLTTSNQLWRTAKRRHVWNIPCWKMRLSSTSRTKPSGWTCVSKPSQCG
ncbi:MAG: hypothetical protein IJQ73_06475 [Kiritimatiellae bacterium]|nr:hypothetical protein [Kiritimatiellia bacterium]